MMRELLYDECTSTMSADAIDLKNYIFLCGEMNE